MASSLVFISSPQALTDNISSTFLFNLIMKQLFFYIFERVPGTGDNTAQINVDTHPALCSANAYRHWQSASLSMYMTE
jgi:hypothetical protein